MNCPHASGRARAIQDGVLLSDPIMGSVACMMASAKDTMSAKCPSSGITVLFPALRWRLLRVLFPWHQPLLEVDNLHHV